MSSSPSLTPPVLSPATVQMHLGSSIIQSIPDEVFEMIADICYEDKERRPNRLGRSMMSDVQVVPIGNLSAAQLTPLRISLFDPLLAVCKTTQPQMFRQFCRHTVFSTTISLRNGMTDTRKKLQLVEGRVRSSILYLRIHLKDHIAVSFNALFEFGKLFMDNNALAVECRVEADGSSQHQESEAVFTETENEAYHDRLGSKAKNIRYTARNSCIVIGEP